MDREILRTFRIRCTTYHYVGDHTVSVTIAMCVRTHLQFGWQKLHIDCQRGQRGHVMCGRRKTSTFEWIQWLMGHVVIYWVSGIQSAGKRTVPSRGSILVRELSWRCNRTLSSSSSCVAHRWPLAALRTFYFAAAQRLTTCSKVAPGYVTVRTRRER